MKRVTDIVEIDQEQLEELKQAVINEDVSLIRRLSLTHNCSDFADLLSLLTPIQIIYVLRIISTNLAGETFSFFSPEIKTSVVETFNSNDINQIIESLKRSEIYELLDELPSNLVTKVIAAASDKGAEHKNYINKILAYEDDMAGSLLNDDFIELLNTDTTDAAINKIRKNYNQFDHISTYYIIDKTRKLVGYISIQKLIFSPPGKLLDEIMDKNVIFVHAQDDQEDVANVFKKYDINELPVVNKEGRLLGVVTIDDVIDVIEEEATEDIQKLAGVNPPAFSYLRSSIWSLTRSRIRWLAFLMVSATLSQIAIAGFIGVIDKNNYLTSAALAYLLSLLPIISGTSGNAGSQSSTVIIRSLSINELKPKDYFTILWKEFRVSLCTGLLLVAINALRMLIINVITNYSSHNNVVMTPDQWKILISTSFALLFTVVLAKIVGITLPILATLVKIDPAVMAAPLLTTLLDAVSTTIFFSAALIVFVI